MIDIMNTDAAIINLQLYYFTVITTKLLSIILKSFKINPAMLLSFCHPFFPPTWCQGVSLSLFILSTESFGHGPLMDSCMNYPWGFSLASWWAWVCR